MTYSWGKPYEVIAQRFLKNELPGMFKKELIVKEGEVCLVEKDVRIKNKFDEGKHTISSLFGGWDYQDIVLVDVSTKKLKRKITNLLTKDDDKVSCNLDIIFRIYSPEKFTKNLMVGKNLLTLEDIYIEMYDALFSKVLSPEVRKENIDDLYGNREVVDRIYAAFEVELKTLLETWGVELVDMNIIWEFPEDYEQQREEKKMINRESDVKETEHKVALKEEEWKKEEEHMKGETKLEETKSELKSERAKREFEIEMSKKESAEDIEEALEGLELKNIMDKQKKLNKEDKDD